MFHFWDRNSCCRLFLGVVSYCLQCSLTNVRNSWRVFGSSLKKCEIFVHVVDLIIQYTNKSSNYLTSIKFHSFMFNIAFKQMLPHFAKCWQAQKKYKSGPSKMGNFKLPKEICPGKMKETWNCRALNWLQSCCLSSAPPASPWNLKLSLLGFHIYIFLWTQFSCPPRIITFIFQTIYIGILCLKHFANTI